VNQRDQQSRAETDASKLERIPEKQLNSAASKNQKYLEELAMKKKKEREAEEAKKKKQAAARQMARDEVFKRN